MSKDAAVKRKQSLAYNLFILTLTIFSLLIMVGMLLPLSESTNSLLQLYDNFICAIFLLDFVITLRAVSSKSDYFFHQRGWLDLLGSIPTFGLVTKFSVLLRLARISRLARIARLLRGMKKKDLVRDALQNRSKYALFVTLLTALIVLSVASLLVLQFESESPDARIRTGGEAIWYSIVTITTVGYGDFYPVTTGGRVTAVFVMLCGVGIIGALASILSSFLIGQSPEKTQEDGQVSPEVLGLEQELADIKSELALLHQLMDKQALEERDKSHDK